MRFTGLQHLSRLHAIVIDNYFLNTYFSIYTYTKIPFSASAKCADFMQAFRFKFPFKNRTKTVGHNIIGIIMAY